MTGRLYWYSHSLGDVDLQTLEDAFATPLEENPREFLHLVIGGRLYRLQAREFMEKFHSLFPGLPASNSSLEAIISTLCWIDEGRFIPLEVEVLLADEVDEQTRGMVYIDFDVDFSKLDREEADLIDKVFGLSVDIDHRRYSLAELAAERKLPQPRIREQFYATIAKIRKAYPVS